MTVQMYVLLAAAILAANLPFLTSRLFFIFQLASKKIHHHLIEWLIYFILIGIFAYSLENAQSSVHKQSTAFYVVVLCLFAIFAFPGFVWRYFWQHKHH